MPSKFDKYELYEDSVQDPERILRNVARTYERIRGREARLLREDFCGTGANSEAWLKRHPKNRAVGIDLDPEPLAWGRKKRFTNEPRMKQIRGNVLQNHGRGFDLVIAFNFSWMVFKTRDLLGRYFDAVRASLGPRGLFSLDLYGGPDSQRETTDPFRMGSYTYYWNQQSWDAVTGDTRCAIHFRLRDGRMKKNVFVYEWRLWTLTETIDLLHDHGFKVLEVQNEIPDATGHGTAAYRPTKRLVNWESYVANLWAAPR